MIKIAIIDNGVAKIPYKNITEIKAYKTKAKLLFKDTRNHSVHSHGSYCAQIIDKYLNQKVVVISITIMEPLQKGNIGNLIAALKWCSKKNIDLVNLSCGSVDVEDGQKVVDFFKKHKGKLPFIIASQNNHNIFTYPANLPDVIGVKCNPKLWNNKYILKNDLNGIDIEASGIHSLSIDSRSIITAPSNSFATAFISSVSANALEKNNIKSKKELLDFLSKNFRKGTL